MTANVDGGATYVITNVKAGTALDLSAGDQRTVTGWPVNGGTNQKWTTEWTGKSWTFRSGSTGKYLGIEGTPANGLSIVAVAAPFEWHIWRDEADQNTFRIFVPFTRQNLDLFGNGRTAPGTPITLWAKWAGVHQTWKFTRSE
ncbi:ricin B-like lectin [Crassisporium funariophilum]|nr:ricin B-like lectin [Crassisporium funariophilum]